MFGLDWEDIDHAFEHVYPDDDDLPFEERAWVKALHEREAARKRFDRLYPDFLFKMGQAAATARQDLAIEILTGRKP